MTWNVETLFPPGSKVSPQSKNPVTEEHFKATLDFLAREFTRFEVWSQSALATHR